MHKRYEPWYRRLASTVRYYTGRLFGRKRYLGRHRSDPVHEVQYSHDVTSTGTLVAMPRERRTPVMILRSIKHRASTARAQAKEPALRGPAIGRVSRQYVDLIVTLDIAMKMIAAERFALTSGPSGYNFTQT